MKKYIFITLVFLCHSLFANEPIHNKVYNKNIKTVLAYKDGCELCLPIIRFNSDEKITLIFDDLSAKKTEYSYSIIHCNSDFTPSNISYNEFADGFEQNPVKNFDYSTNTITSYLHYTITIPNEDCTLKLSGNYIIKVFQTDNPDSVILTQRFYIYESAANIDIKLIRPVIPKYSYKKQQFQLKISPNVTGLSDPYNEIETFVYQNYPHEQLLIKPRITFLNDNTYTYDDVDENIFNGINEFRNFDAKSIKYQSQRIQSISYSGPYYTIKLYPDADRYKTPYFSDNDLNGKKYIENKLGLTKGTDADYINVEFTLPYPDIVVDGNIYVFGALSDWQCSNENKMTYNFDTKAYKLNMLLKQGYYNYLFAYKSNNDEPIDLSYIEGNHYETENDYLVFVYFKPSMGRYHRLIGYKSANSIGKNTSNYEILK